MIRIEVLWPYKYLLLNDEVVYMVLGQCHMIMDRVNCHNPSLGLATKIGFMKVRAKSEA
jgi:hypothetical protein